MKILSTMNLVILISLIILGVIIVGCSSTKYIEGVVVDYQTSKSISNVEISVNQIGWRFSEMRFVWDKRYVYKTMSDDSGKFKVEYSVGSLAPVKAIKEEYIEFDGVYKKNSSITIKLKRKNPNYIPLPYGNLQIGIRNGRPYGWIFSEQKITFNRKEADIFPKFNEEVSRKNIILETYGKGGITFETRDELGAEYDLLIYSSDFAPLDGYMSSSELDFNGPKAVYFVKTNDGNHFAKFSFDPSGYATIGSEQDIEHGNWGLMLEYVYNPDGTRNLEFQR